MQSFKHERVRLCFFSLNFFNDGLNPGVPRTERTLPKGHTADHKITERISSIWQMAVLTTKQFWSYFITFCFSNHKLRSSLGRFVIFLYNMQHTSILTKFKPINLYSPVCIRCQPTCTCSVLMKSGEGVTFHDHIRDAGKVEAERKMEGREKEYGERIPENEEISPSLRPSSLITQ